MIGRTARLVLLVLASTACTIANAQGAGTRQWNFRVLLDGEPIGNHRFVVATRGDARVVTSEASFDVRMLGFTAYRYRHRANERWERGCLAEIRSTTDDDGKLSSVDAPAAGVPLQGCVYSFAYWNPLMLKQTQLLNAQTGKLETVTVTRIGEGSVDVQGVPTPAVRWRISGAQQPIELWYSAQGDWLALDSSVAGGRTLSYRIDKNMSKDTE